MKIFFLFILVLTLNVGYISSQDTDGSLVFFDGIGNPLPNYAPSSGATNDTTFISLKNQVNHMMLQTSAKNNQALIAHSQGGVRALGYASAMSKAGLGQKISALITIGSPVMGVSTLRQGMDVLKTRVDNLIKTFSEGVRLTAVVFGMGQDYQNALNGMTITGFETDSLILKLYGKTLSQLLTQENGILDLSPESTWYKENIAPQTTTSGKWVAVPTGAGYSPYTYYYVISSSSTTASAKIPSTIPLGYIAGEKSSITDVIWNNMTLSALYKNEKLPFWTSYAVKMAPGLASTALGNAAYKWRLDENEKRDKDYWAEFGDNANPFDGDSYQGHYMVQAQQSSRNAAACDAAKDLAVNYQTYMDNILGSPIHDGLIVAADQWANFSGEKNLGGRPFDSAKPDLSIMRTQTNHISEKYDRSIWGSDSLNDEPLKYSMDRRSIGPGGQIDKWLSAGTTITKRKNDGNAVW